MAITSGLFAMSAVSPAPLVDPDRYFHFELSRRMLEVGLVRDLPQVSDTAWARHFVDKELLFHVFTALAYAVAGPTAVVWFCHGLAALLVCLCYLGARFWLRPAPAFALVFAVVFSCEDPVFRLVLVRAYLLAQLLVVGLILALVQRRERVVGAMTLLYALAYHALYVPGIVVAVFSLAHGRRLWDTRRLVAWAGGGLALGLLVNPYFPDTLLLSAKIARIAVDANSAGYGEELFTKPTHEFLTRYGGPLMVLGAATLALLASSTKVRQSVHARFLFGVAFVFWGLSTWSPRALEYALPVTIFAAALISEGLPLRLVLSTALAIIVAQVPAYRGALLTTPPEFQALRARLSRGVEAIPHDGRPHKVFHCSFDTGTLLFGARPDLRVVDVLDPTFLTLDAPKLAQLRRLVCANEVADPAAVVGDDFGADLVAVRFPEQLDAFESATDFVRLAPGAVTLEQGLFVYRRVENPHVVRAYSTPSGVRETTRAGGSVAAGELQAGGCVSADVPVEQVAAHQGADVALIGGGPRVRLLVDGTAVFDSGIEYELPRRHRTWVRLPAPLRATSAVRVELCAGRAGAQAVAALELWKAEEVRAFCRARGQAISEVRAQWRDATANACVAPWATPSVLPPSPRGDAGESSSGRDGGA